MFEKEEKIKTSGDGNTECARVPPNMWHHQERLPALGGTYIHVRRYLSFQHTCWNTHPSLSLFFLSLSFFPLSLSRVACPYCQSASRCSLKGKGREKEEESFEDGME